MIAIHEQAHAQRKGESQVFFNSDCHSRYLSKFGQTAVQKATLIKIKDQKQN